jgi:site-specific DNA recombinase
MELLGYVRVSRVGGREGESFISTDVQRERIEGYARSQGHAVVEWETDLDQPGSRIERPGFQRALEAVERGQVEGIIVAKLDRFARSVAGAAKALERLEAVNGTLVAVDVGMDTTTSAGNLMRNVLMALAEFELERIRESWEAARNHAIARGVHISNRPAVGYLRGDDGRLVPDPVAAPVIQEVFRRRASGESLSRLCDYLNESLPKDNEGAWSITTVTSILQRRVYLGEAYAGEIVNESAHEPLVAPNLWFAAQALPATYIRRENQSLLAGLIKCAACGYTMTRVGGGSRGYRNYRCTVRHSTGNCPEPARISTKKADGYVLSQISQWIKAGEQDFHASEVEQQLADAQARAESAEAELIAFRDSEAASIIGQDSFLEGLRTRQGTLEAVQQELDTLQHTASAAVIPELTEGAFSSFLEQDEKKQRDLVVMVLDSVTVKRAENPNSKFADPAERMAIHWKQML